LDLGVFSVDLSSLDLSSLVGAGRSTSVGLVVRGREGGRLVCAGKGTSEAARSAEGRLVRTGKGTIVTL